MTFDIRFRRFWSEIFIAILLLLGCQNPSSADRAHGSPNRAAFQQSKKNNDQSSQVPIDPGVVDEQLKNLFKVTYRIAVSITGATTQPVDAAPAQGGAQAVANGNGTGTQSNAPLEVCHGNVEFSINPSLGKLDLTKLIVIKNPIPFDCGILGTIDIAKLLRPILASTDPSKLSAGPIPVTAADNMILLRNLGDTKFDPPRPFMPSLASGDPKALANLRVQREVKATTAEGSASGTVIMTMNSFDQQLVPPYIDHSFKHVMDFETAATGFESIDGLKALAIDFLRFRLNTSPISILHFEAKIRLDKIVDTIGQSGGFQFNQDALSGILTALPSVQAFLATPFAQQIVVPPVKILAKNAMLFLNVDLVSQQGLDSKSAEEISSTEETFNGKPI